jgi:hypothetical protein
MALPGEISANDLPIAIPDGLMNLLLDGAFWKGVAALEMLFKPIPIVSCLTYLEGDEAPFSSIYACYLTIVFHILSEGQCEAWVPRRPPERYHHREHEEPSTPPFQHRLNDATIENMKNHLRHRFNTA